MKMIAIMLYSIAYAASVMALPPGLLKTASLSVRVIDENRIPVTNAKVSVDYYLGYGAGMMRKFEKNEDLTDTNGLCRLSGMCDGKIGWNIEKQGYYITIGPQLNITNSTLTHWQLEDEYYEVVLRPVLNPIPMYAKVLRMDTSPFPAYDELLGYDLEKGDWLPPRGNGQTADFIFRLHCDWSENTSSYGEQYYHATLELTFSNEDDGIIEFRDSQPKLEGSIFRLPRFAPEFGYTNRWVSERFLNDTGSTWATISQREDMNYFFRVRTKRDETNRIISAHYGKISGPLDFGIRGTRNGLGMTYYFNPTSNDRNMEYDPKRNLFTGLKVGEQVREP